jgi:hypothetical protein
MREEKSKNANKKPHLAALRLAKGKNKNSLGGLEVGGDGVEVVAEARGDTHARHHHTLQAVDHLDLRAGHSSFRQCVAASRGVSHAATRPLYLAMSTPFHTFVLKTTTFPHHHNYVHASTWRAWQGPAHLQRDGEGRTETGARPARAFGVTARAGLVLTAASLLARKLEVRSEVGAKPLTLKHAASGNTCTKHRRKLCHREPTTDHARASNRLNQSDREH